MTILREEYFRRLVDNAHVELYLSGMDGARIYWPWRMLPPKDATLSYRNACEKFIIDSDPKRDEWTTKDALDAGHRLGAEVVSLADVYQDKNATVDELLEGLEVADDHAFDGALLLPLQYPFDECYAEIGSPTEHWIGIGGLKNESAVEKLNAAQKMREVVGPDVWLHGFGWGPRGVLAEGIRQDKGLLDSLDNSTPVQNVPYGDSTPGKERKSITAAYAGFELIRDLREVTPHPDSITPEMLRDESQSGMESWQ